MRARLAQSAPVSDERWTWATVTTSSVDGLRVQLDGDPAPLDVQPVNLAGALDVDDRVLVHRYRRRLIVHGKPS